MALVWSTAHSIVDADPSRLLAVPGLLPDMLLALLPGMWPTDCESESLPVGDSQRLSSISVSSAANLASVVSRPACSFQ